ncbi:MAG: gfo/Idh/MocA family oxidoreductase [Lentisphaerae bacterium]|nr:MAG: gfo/Idh/MocA family oxidoreductase [Lentisphaerota bacterium]
MEDHPMSEATAYYIGDILMNEPLTDPIRTAIVGLGRIGYGHHAKTILKHNGFTLCAVCDREPSRVEELVSLAHCNGYTSYEEMLKQEDIELVVVASQSHDHVRHTELALRAGKHVLCEKPACQQA